MEFLMILMLINQGFEIPLHYSDILEILITNWHNYKIA
jgi:hypothetical protein